MHIQESREIVQTNLFAGQEQSRRCREQLCEHSKGCGGEEDELGDQD